MEKSISNKKISKSIVLVIIALFTFNILSVALCNTYANADPVQHYIDYCTTENINGNEIIFSNFDEQILETGDLKNNNIDVKCYEGNFNWSNYNEHKENTPPLKQKFSKNIFSNEIINEKLVDDKLTLKINWKQIFEEEGIPANNIDYTMVFEFTKNISGGYYKQISHAIHYKHAIEIDLPDAPEKPGYHFVGWFYDAQFTEPVQTGDTITEDTDLYAKYEINTYKITYILNNEIYNVSEINYNEKCSNVVPEDSDTPGKTFSGWFTDSEYTKAYDFESAVTSNMTLYGKLETIVCKVTLYIGDEVFKTLEVPYGCTLVEFAETKAEGAAAVAAVMNVYNISLDKDMAITEDIEANATMDEQLLGWNSFGAWVIKNWVWVVVAICLLILIIIGSCVMVAKHKHN